MCTWFSKENCKNYFDKKTKKVHNSIIWLSVEYTKMGQKDEQMYYKEWTNDWLHYTKPWV